MNHAVAENVALELLKAWLPGAINKAPSDPNDGGITGRWIGEAFNAIVRTVLQETKK